MRQSTAPITILALIGTLEAKPQYFHRAIITSVEKDHVRQIYVIDSPLGIFTAGTQQSFRRKPRFAVGPIRVSIEPKADAGDSLYLLDENDREYRALILERKSHPPPPPVPANLGFTNGTDSALRLMPFEPRSSCGSPRSPCARHPGHPSPASRFPGPPVPCKS